MENYRERAWEREKRLKRPFLGKEKINTNLDEMPSSATVASHTHQNGMNDVSNFWEKKNLINYKKKGFQSN